MLITVVYMKEAKKKKKGLLYLTFLSAFPSIILMTHNFSKYSVLLRAVTHLIN